MPSSRWGGRDWSPLSERREETEKGWQIDYKEELTYVIIEADKSQDLQLVSWDPGEPMFLFKPGGRK